MENPVKNNAPKGIDKYKFTNSKNNVTVPSVPNSKSKQNILSIEYFKGVYADYLLEQLVKPDSFSNSFSYPSNCNNPVMWHS